MDITNNTEGEDWIPNAIPTSEQESTATTNNIATTSTTIQQQQQQQPKMRTSFKDKQVGFRRKKKGTKKQQLNNNDNNTIVSSNMISNKVEPTSIKDIAIETDQSSDNNTTIKNTTNSIANNNTASFTSKESNQSSKSSAMSNSSMSMKSSIKFSYKDIYGEDDEDNLDLDDIIEQHKGTANQSGGINNSSANNDKGGDIAMKSNNNNKTLLLHKQETDETHQLLSKQNSSTEAYNIISSQLMSHSPDLDVHNDHSTSLAQQWSMRRRPSTTDQESLVSVKFNNSQSMEEESDVGDNINYHSSDYYTANESSSVNGEEDSSSSSNSSFASNVRSNSHPRTPTETPNNVDNKNNTPNNNTQEEEGTISGLVNTVISNSPFNSIRQSLTSKWMGGGSSSGVLQQQVEDVDEQQIKGEVDQAVVEATVGDDNIECSSSEEGEIFGSSVIDVATKLSAAEEEEERNEAIHNNDDEVDSIDRELNEIQSELPITDEDTTSPMPEDNTDMSMPITQGGRRRSSDLIGSDSSLGDGSAGQLMLDALRKSQQMANSDLPAITDDSHRSGPSHHLDSPESVKSEYSTYFKEEVYSSFTSSSSNGESSIEQMSDHDDYNNNDDIKQAVAERRSSSTIKPIAVGEWQQQEEQQQEPRVYERQLSQEEEETNLIRYNPTVLPNGVSDIIGDIMSSDSDEEDNIVKKSQPQHLRHKSTSSSKDIINQLLDAYDSSSSQSSSSSKRRRRRSSKIQKENGIATVKEQSESPNNEKEEQNVGGLISNIFPKPQKKYQSNTNDDDPPNNNAKRKKEDEKIPFFRKLTSSFNSSNRSGGGRGSSSDDNILEKLNLSSSNRSLGEEQGDPTTQTQSDNSGDKTLPFYSRFTNSTLSHEEASKPPSAPPQQQSLSDKRVTEVEERLNNELQQLQLDIWRIGDPTQSSVTFGELFDDESCQNHYEGIAATLKAAKKRNIVTYKSPILLKGAHDKVLISLVDTTPLVSSMDKSSLVDTRGEDNALEPEVDNKDGATEVVVEEEEDHPIQGKEWGIMTGEQQPEEQEQYANATLANNTSHRSSGSLPSFYSSASELSRFRPSLVNDFKATMDRESFHRSMGASALLDEGGNTPKEKNGDGGVDWPSPVSSLASPPTVPVLTAVEVEESGELSMSERGNGKDTLKNDNPTSILKSDDVQREDKHVNKDESDQYQQPSYTRSQSNGSRKSHGSFVVPTTFSRSRSGSGRISRGGGDQSKSNHSNDLSNSMASVDFGDNELVVDWAPQDEADDVHEIVDRHSNASKVKRSIARTDSSKKIMKKLKASTQSTEAYMLHTFNDKKKVKEGRSSDVLSALSDISYGSMLDGQNNSGIGASPSVKFGAFYDSLDNTTGPTQPEEGMVHPSLPVEREGEEDMDTADQQGRPPLLPNSSRSSSALSRSSRSSKYRGRRTMSSVVSSLDSLASPVDFVRRQSNMLTAGRVPSDSSLSSMDSLASPTYKVALKKSDHMAEVEITPADESKRDFVKVNVPDIPDDVPTDLSSPPPPSSRLQSSLNSEQIGHSRSTNEEPALEDDIQQLETINNVPDISDGIPHSRPQGEKPTSRHSLAEDSLKLEELLNNIDGDINEASGDTADAFKVSGLGNDVALHLDHSQKGMNDSSFFSTDGIDAIDPSATTVEGRDDFDFALNSYTDAIKNGHFDFHDNKATLEHSSLEGSDTILAARAYLGLGYARQCRGELESSLTSYTTSLTLWEEELGPNDPLIASIQFTIGTVLIEMQRKLEAADHFTKALHLFKYNNSLEGKEDGYRSSILSTEGMLFSVLGEGIRAIDCFRQAVLVYQNAQHSMNLLFATIMFELGSLLSILGKYDDSSNCFHFALEIRKALLGDSFVVARTHYSLGVTLACQGLESGVDTTSASHLEEALRICEEGFIKTDNLQSAIIIHALGVLNERRGDFLSASLWFSKEHSMRKMLFGEEHESVASVSVDLGTCYYNSGKYNEAIATFENDLRIILLDDNDRSAEVAESLYKIASCHDSLCNYDEALDKFQEVKKIRESIFGVESCPVVQTMLRIGNILLCTGEAGKALDCFSEILGIGYSSDTVTAIEVANALYGRGCAQFCLFYLADAMKSFNESLNWKLAALGEDDPGLACIFYQMAHVYLEQSEHEEAITCFEEYSRLQKLESQRNLHDNAEICYAEGIVAKLQERQDDALSFYNQALAMFDTLFGGEHEKIASIHFDIGCIHSAMNDHEDALGHFQICLLQRRRLLGCHVDVANVLYEMASIYAQQDRAQLAVKCMAESDRIYNTTLKNNEKLISILLLSGKLWKSLAIYEAAQTNFEQALEQAITVYGQEHELVARILLSLGELLQEMNEMTQALFCFDESIQVRAKLDGQDSSSVGQVEYSKGVALLFHGKFDEAAICLNRALRIRQETFGDFDADAGDILNTLGYMQLRKGNVFGDEVMDPFTKALEIRRAVGNKAKVVSTLQNIASVYKKRKDYDACLDTHAEIVAVRQEDFGFDDLRVSDSFISLGNIQTIAGKLADANASYEEALRIRTLVNGYNHTSVAQVLFKIGSIHSRLNSYDDAKQLFEEYMRIRSDEEDDPDEEMAQALTLMGDLQKETNEKSKAQINWQSAMEIYEQLEYPDDHPKVVKLKMRQGTVESLRRTFFKKTNSTANIKEVNF